jgi:hypothetical protein
MELSHDSKGYEPRRVKEIEMMFSKCEIAVE